MIFDLALFLITFYALQYFRNNPMANEYWKIVFRIITKILTFSESIPLNNSIHTLALIKKELLITTQII